MGKRWKRVIERRWSEEEREERQRRSRRIGRIEEKNEERRR